MWYLQEMKSIHPLLHPIQTPHKEEQVSKPAHHAQSVRLSLYLSHVGADRKMHNENLESLQETENFPSLRLIASYNMWSMLTNMVTLDLF